MPALDRETLAALLCIALVTSLCSGLPGQDPAAQDRALYVWKLADELPNQDLLLACATEMHIKHFYLAIPKDAATMREAIDHLIGTGNALGIRSHAVLSENTWALRENHAAGLNRLYGLLVFNRSLSESARVRGIHIDVEVHSLPEFRAAKKAYKDTGDPAALATLQDLMVQWLDFVEAAVAMAHAEIPSLDLSVIVPQWFMKTGSFYDVSWKGVYQNVTLHLMDLVDEIVVLAYYHKPTKVAKRAAEEVAAAATPGRARVRVAVNISHKSVPTETLWYGGLDAMTTALAHIQTTYEGAPGYAGTAIHMYESLRMLLYE